MTHWKKFNREDDTVFSDLLAHRKDELCGPFDIWIVCKGVAPDGESVVVLYTRRLTEAYWNPEFKVWRHNGDTIKTMVTGGRNFVTHYAIPDGPQEGEQ